MDKIINSTCACSISLSEYDWPQIMLEPCEHILHKKCYESNKRLCPICKHKIEKCNTFDNIKKEAKNNMLSYQKYVDMISVSNFNNLSESNISISGIIDFIGILSKLPFMAGYTDGRNGSGEILNLMNAHLIVHGTENIIKTPKVYISTHTTFIDFIVIIYILKCGFLSSSYIKKSWYGRLITNIIPLLLLNRGKKSNTVDRMKKYIKNHGSICLFPEGMITHPDTITRFRTGAFYVGYPVVPVVITYNPPIYDSDINTFIKKMTSSSNLTITMKILPPEMPPFDNTHIENIRCKMAEAGNLAISRVSNKDLSD